MEKIKEEIIEENVVEAFVESEALPDAEIENGSEVTEDISTVSGGDSIASYNMDEDILTALSDLSEQNELLLTELEEMQEIAELSIMDKPLADYTPTEGMLLILVFIALGTTIFRIVGGIIKL